MTIYGLAIQNFSSRKQFFHVQINHCYQISQNCPFFWYKKIGLIWINAKIWYFSKSSENIGHIMKVAISQNLFFMLFSATVDQKYVNFGSKLHKNRRFTLKYSENSHYEPISQKALYRFFQLWSSLRIFLCYQWDQLCMLIIKINNKTKINFEQTSKSR